MVVAERSEIRCTTLYSSTNQHQPAPTNTNLDAAAHQVVRIQHLQRTTTVRVGPEKRACWLLPTAVRCSPTKPPMAPPYVSLQQGEGSVDTPNRVPDCAVLVVRQAQPAQPHGRDQGLLNQTLHDSSG